MIKLFFLLSSYLFSLGPFVSGSFYPDKKEEIELFIKERINTAQTYVKNIKKDDVKAVIVPHAGYIYSGNIALISYLSIAKNTERFIILSPSHRIAIDGAATVKEDFETPLGKTEVDREFIDIILKDKIFEEKRDAFINEHSIEVQLPFIKYFFKNARIVPILLNTEDLSKLTKIAGVIKSALKKDNKKSIIIISSDFSHYPASNDSIKSDLTMVKAIETLDENYINLTSKVLLTKKVESLETTACGISAIITGVNLAKLMGANSFNLIKNSNSYLETKNEQLKDRVVGYVSGAFIEQSTRKENELTKKDKKILLENARKSIINYASGKKEIIFQGLYDNPYFNLPKAVFVTLKKKGNLRGCMGTTQPITGLYDAVKYFAVIAANEDPRFSPVKIEEMKDIKIEISILSSLKKINGYKDIKKGDGVVLIAKKGSGLFLPQVWEELNNKEDFLSELCYQKAGDNRDCWKDPDTQFFIFSVEKFEE